MAKKEDLMSGFGTRINEGSPTLRKSPAAPVDGERSGEREISGQERERRSRAGRRTASDTSKRVTESYTYTSLALDDELYEKIREIARRNSLPYRDIINAALRKFIELYELKNGKISTSRESRISADSLV